MAVVAAGRVTRVHRVRDHSCVDTELAQRLPAALCVHDDSVEPAEQPPPEIYLAGRAPREQVVCGEDRRRAKSQPDISLRQSEPLQVNHIGPRTGERGEHGDVLNGLQRETQA